MHRPIGRALELAITSTSVPVMKIVGYSSPWTRSLLRCPSRPKFRPLEITLDLQRQ